MIPSRRLVLLAALLSLPLLFSGLDRTVADTALLANLLLLGLAVVDLLISSSPHDIEVLRRISDVLSLGADNPAVLQVRNLSQQPLEIELHDDAGPLCAVERLPQSLELGVGKSGEVSYIVRPGRRGASVMPAVHLRFRTRLGLWVRQQERPLETHIRIYPDIRAVYRYELLARQNRLAEIGVRMVRMPGQGREFERLREYRYGDEIRQVDWKATSRQRQLISREFNTERNQNIVILVDCGRFMRNESEGISYLDLALNSAIMLSYIALGQGDNVSLLAFSSRIERFVRPVRGKPGIQQILRSTYDIQASSGVSDYSLALEYLTTVQRKRALVVLITFVTDELQMKVIGDSLRLRSLPYLPLCVLLQDDGLQAMAGRIPGTDLEACHTAAAAQILSGQTHQAAVLRESGVMLIETSPKKLTERLINEYLSIKARNLM
ncbi:MAG TPA: hypothetical protein DIT89_10150 [Planctomycetaceae bacterium]|nr:hypothetical protein [Planctomycetaceae bacterium]